MLLWTSPTCRTLLLNGPYINVLLDVKRNWTILIFKVDCFHYKRHDRCSEKKTNCCVKLIRREKFTANMYLNI